MHRIIDAQHHASKSLDAVVALKHSPLNPMCHAFDTDMLTGLRCQGHVMPRKQVSASWLRVYEIEKEGVTIT